MRSTIGPASAGVETALRAGVFGAAGVLLGILLSGPAAVALVQAIQPQPAWRDAATFAQSHHPVQLLPYLGGIVLVAALVVLIASLHAVAPPEHRVWTSAAIVFTAVFASLIFFNYVVQTTFLPVLASDFEPADAGLIATFSMANPTSLAWGIEMWGWGFLGVATWLCASIFRGNPLERAAAIAFAANGPVSIAGAMWTVLQPGWVMTAPGLAAFAVWNLLLAAMAVLALAVFRTRLRDPTPVRPPEGALGVSPL